MAVDARGTPAAEAEPSAPSAARRARLALPRPAPLAAEPIAAPPARPRVSSRPPMRSALAPIAATAPSPMLPAAMPTTAPMAPLMSSSRASCPAVLPAASRAAHVVGEAQLLAHTLNGLLHALELRVGGRAVLAVCGDGLLGAREFLL